MMLKKKTMKFLIEIYFNPKDILFLCINIFNNGELLLEIKIKIKIFLHIAKTDKDTNE